MIWIGKIVPYDNQPTDKMHIHVHFAEEGAKYHRSCEVVVFVDKKDPRPLAELKEAAVELAYDYLEQVVKGRQRAEVPEAAAKTSVDAADGRLLMS